MSLSSVVPPIGELTRLRRSDPALADVERAVLENFGAEERVSDARAEAYASAVGAGPWAAFGDFKVAHERRYLPERLHLGKTEAGVPDTFDVALNGGNYWAGIDDSVMLYRVESVTFALDSTGMDEMELELAISNFASADAGTREDGRVVLQRLLDNWNDRRDRRPLFATTDDEIGDLLAASGDNWANALRDRLGLGHFNPAPGRPERVLLMRYAVKEVRECKAAGGSAFCIPTVLDGPLNPYFFPTPLVGPQAPGSERGVGRAVNLCAVTQESDYRMGLELVHSYVAYRPDHIARWGLVSSPTTSNLAQLRKFHLAWLKLDTDRDNYGCDFTHV